MPVCIVLMAYVVVCHALEEYVIQRSSIQHVFEFEEPHLFTFGWLYRYNDRSYAWNVYGIKSQIITFSEVEAPRMRSHILLGRDREAV